ncbi:DNA-binding GntR family transcriptional regulator [Trinickia symbiotica]|uniref:GntR family transcriptional regulator n=1 Tax=Trinickia symbiotica TaxID=863227 RepID=A0A2N7X5F1_9BURK|nr:GntR family transcriptional regulator [Trinickia symbiotica]PMS36840.1 GntR family transcriptional regulator [Trinickia symbiotica]PPK46297.1 DNA-binding GntR family transcriptional regulator [Trinickia symbiotica]
MARVARTKLSSAGTVGKASAVRYRMSGIYQTLRDRICTLYYPPGTVLGATALAEEFQVSRTPIRQNLQKLEYEGLVETRNGVGTIVSGGDLREYRDTYAFQLRLSEMLGDFCSPAHAPKALERMQRLAVGAKTLQHQQASLQAFWQILHELHSVINGLITNGEVRQTHDRCYLQASRLRLNIVAILWDEEVKYLNWELEECCSALRARDMRALGLVQRNYISFSLARIARFIS